MKFEEDSFNNEIVSTLNDPGKQPFKNFVGKGENDGTHYSLLLWNVLYYFPKQNSIFESHF